MSGPRRSGRRDGGLHRPGAELTASWLAQWSRRGIASVWRHLPEQVRRRHRLIAPLNRRYLAAGALPVAEQRMRSGDRLRLDLRSGTEWLAYYTGEYDEQRVGVARALLSAPGAVAVDAGANIGFWSVPLARQVARSGGRLIAIEPIPQNVARLRENLALNGLQPVVEVFEVAVSAHHGEARISLREDFRGGASTGNAALVIDDGADFGLPQLVVETVPLDALLERCGSPLVRVVKADLEGHEDRFLAGATATFERCRPVAFLEWNRIYHDRRGIDAGARIDGLLEGLDYRCLGHRGGRWQLTRSFFSPREIDDLILVPQEKVATVRGLLAHGS